LEFSNGLFSNLNIETQREVAKTAVNENAAPAAAVDPGFPKPEVVSFTVKANFSIAKPEPQASTPAPGSQVAMKK